MALYYPDAKPISSENALLNMKELGLAIWLKCRGLYDLQQ